MKKLLGVFDDYFNVLAWLLVGVLVVSVVGSFMVKSTDKRNAKVEFEIALATPQALQQSVNECPALQRTLQDKLPISNVWLGIYVNECKNEQIKDALANEQRKALEAIKLDTKSQ
jgi:protein gp37